jgi:hypothetical protein
MSFIKNIIFYVILSFIYLIIIELFSRTLIFYTTKNSNIYSFGFKKDINFEIVDLSNLEFNIIDEEKILFNDSQKIQKKKNNTKEDAISVWVYGASLSHGYSCGEKSSSWPNELVNINDKINIINFSFPGVHSDHSIKKLKYDLSKNILEKPDLIIWAHRDEEVLSIYKGIERNNNRITNKFNTKEINKVTHFLLRLNKTADNKLTFFRIMNYGFHKINHTAYKARDKIKPTDNDYKLAIENYKWNTIDAINAAKNNNVNKFIILSLFSIEQVNNKASNPVLLEEYFKIVKSIQKDHKIGFLSTSKYLSETNIKNIDNYFCENNHFNLMGNELISKIVNNYILQN